MGRSNEARRTVDLFEHVVHALDVIVVEEPRLAVLFVLLEWDTERIGDVDGLDVVLSQEDADDPFCRVAGDRSGVVVCHGQEDERVDDCRDRACVT